MEVHTLAGKTPEGGVVGLYNPSGKGPFVIACEHASNFIPDELNNLGLDDAALNSHIAWDPGAQAVAEVMALALDAPLVVGRVSRLVYDCNRTADAPSAIADESDNIAVPGNQNLSEAERRDRAERFYQPFHDALAAALDAQVKTGRLPTLITVHSFTPVYNGQRRELDIGILHDADTRLADSMLDIAEADDGVLVLRNAPYGPEDGVTYTLVKHAIKRGGRGLLNVMIEIRNDLIADEASQKVMAERLTRYITGALDAISKTTKLASGN